MIPVINFEELEQRTALGCVLRYSYRTLAEKNIAFFETLFGSSKASCDPPSGENKMLIQRISKAVNIEEKIVEHINNADELLNSSIAPASPWQTMGCTSVTKQGIVGQTLDLYTVALAILREGDALYVTMPPYLALMGMNSRIAFCTNAIFGQTQHGIPVSHIRRNILRYNSLDDTVAYLTSVKPATTANILLSDGKRAIDVELAPQGCKVHHQAEGKTGMYFAHTNHELTNVNIRKDNSCSRLSRAVNLLETNTNISEILQDKGISVPICAGFGTIITVIMDVNARVMHYKEPGENAYKTVQLK